jgi:DNA-binding transcriptional LysR family regulator
MHFVDLTRREADLAVRTRRPQTGDLVSIKLGERCWIPMQARPAATSHEGVEGKKGSRPIQDWGALPWIGWGNDMTSFPPAAWVARHVPRAAIVLRTSHFTSQAAAVVAGLGVALLPPAYTRVAPLVPVRYAAALTASVAELPRNETWLVGHRALRNVPRVEAVWSFLVEEFARFEPAPA